MTHLDTALHLARLGYYVHPLVPGDKMPIAGGNGSNDATRDEELIRVWWEDCPEANVGISLDKTGLVAIAPDCPEWAERFKANSMPSTVLFASGGGAGHWHTWLPCGGPVARICVPKQYDIMSQGNAVAPGSIHPSGRSYELRTALLPVENLPLAPAWAIKMLAALLFALASGASRRDIETHVRQLAREVGAEAGISVITPRSRIERCMPRPGACWGWSSRQPCGTIAQP
ncbi:MAG TPA: bifunctional DNA primase/polymerase [Roseiflexaceae bacterium]|nr:bifunctional DNA primase/polymerase [Roseiflexaceae bacterium]